MSTIDDETLRRLDTLNIWLGDVFGEGTRLSSLLREAGLNEAEVEAIKHSHLSRFLQAVITRIERTTDQHDGERRNDVMVRHYGLATGRRETLQSIGESLQLSRERIRQLVEKRIRVYRNAKRKEQIKLDLAAMASELLYSDDTRKV